MHDWNPSGQYLLRSLGFSAVILVGLKQTSFYFATRLLSQMGTKQVIPSLPEHTYASKAVSPSVVKTLVSRWPDVLHTTHIGFTHGLFELDEEYKQWLAQPVGAQVKKGTAKVVGLIKNPLSHNRGDNLSLPPNNL